MDLYLELDGWCVKVCRLVIRTRMRSGTRCHSWHNRRRNLRERGRVKWSHSNTLQLVFSTGGFAGLLSLLLTNNLHRGLSVKTYTRRISLGSVPQSVHSMIGVRSDQHVLEPKPNKIRLKWVMERFPRFPLSTLKASLEALRGADRWDMNKADMISLTIVFVSEDTIHAFQL